MITKFTLVKVVGQEKEGMNTIGLFGIVSKAGDDDPRGYNYQVEFFKRTIDTNRRTSWWFTEEQLDVIADLSHLIKDIDYFGKLTARKFIVKDWEGTFYLAGFVDTGENISGLIFSKYVEGQPSGHDGLVPGSFFFEKESKHKKYWFIGIGELFSLTKQGRLIIFDSEDRTYKDQKLNSFLETVSIGDKVCSLSLSKIDSSYTISKIDKENIFFEITDDATNELVVISTHNSFVTQFYLQKLNIRDTVKASEKALLDFLGAYPKEEVNAG